MQFTPEQFKTIFPSNKTPEKWIRALGVLTDYGISTNFQVAAFCSQIGHEQNDITVLEENLNYSAESLVKVFPKYFKDVDPTQYARNPEKIANRVYANRMGNANEDLGDGWKYRGRGCIQLTGRENYYNCSLDLFDDATVLVDNPDQVAKDPEIAIKSALWFWKKNGLQNLTDIVTIQKRVNGGTHGMEDRIARYERALHVL